MAANALVFGIEKRAGAAQTLDLHHVLFVSAFADSGVFERASRAVDVGLIARRGPDVAHLNDALARAARRLALDGDGLHLLCNTHLSFAHAVSLCSSK